MEKKIPFSTNDVKYDKTKKINWTKEDRKRFIQEINDELKIILEENDIKKIRSRQMARDMWVR